MDIYTAAERLMRMDDEDWARHANPWSVWSRFSCLPLMVLAIWSRVWFGWWAVLLFALAALWTFVNPRAFSAATDFGTWAGRATLGERVFLKRKTFGVPDHHARAAHVLTGLSVLGLVPLIYGLVALDLWATSAGLIAVILPKVWFCDRMVWLHVELTGVPMGTAMPAPLMPQERMFS